MVALLSPLAQTAEPDVAGGAALIGGLSIFTILGLLCVGIVLVLFLFAPVFVAVFRGHPNTAAIAVLNLLLGWTVVGWMIALVWSFTDTGRPRYD